MKKNAAKKAGATKGANAKSTAPAKKPASKKIVKTKKTAKLVSKPKASPKGTPKSTEKKITGKKATGQKPAENHVKQQNKVQHDYHLVDPSPWPIVGATGAFFTLVGAVFWMYEDYDFYGLGLGGNPAAFFGGLALVLYTMAGWWRDIVREAAGQTHHTPVVKLSFRYAMLLFIIIEVMFFTAWCWAYLVSLQSTTDASLGSWPLEGLVTFNSWLLPLFNTLLLLISVTTIIWAGYAIRMDERKDAVRGLALSIVLGLCFIGLQIYQYAHAAIAFGINGSPLVSLATTGTLQSDLASRLGNLDANFGSIFFMVTFIHGLHVVVGVIFLTVCLFRVMLGHFTPQSYFGFEAAAWYWYFVNVVWLFIFATIYVWGAGGLSAVANSS
jgi:cytochrome c oxidase subunit 3